MVHDEGAKDGVLQPALILFLKIIKCKFVKGTSFIQSLQPEYSAPLLSLVAKIPVDIVKYALEPLLTINYEVFLSCPLVVEKYRGNRQSDQKRLNEPAGLGLFPDISALELRNDELPQFPFLMKQFECEVCRIGCNMVVGRSGGALSESSASDLMSSNSRLTGGWLLARINPLPRCRQPDVVHQCTDRKQYLDPNGLARSGFTQSCLRFVPGTNQFRSRKALKWNESGRSESQNTGFPPQKIGEVEKSASMRGLTEVGGPRGTGRVHIPYGVMQILG